MYPVKSVVNCFYNLIHTYDRGDEGRDRGGEAAESGGNADTAGASEE